MTAQYDQLYRYLFKQADVRGELVRIRDSYQQMLENHDYPDAIADLLGELMAATSLLTATLKFKGDIALQLQSEGVVRYAVVNGTDQQALRGVARWEGEPVSGDFSALFEKGFLAITITPQDGERYQGIVALDKPTLAECLEAYFEQSEQLPTKVVLHTRRGENAFAGGMLVQVLPSVDSDLAQFDHLSQLTQTITADELFDIEPTEVLHRLYHQEDAEVYSPTGLRFECSCSKSRSAQALANVSKQELLAVIAEQGAVSITCQYCNKEYRFDSVDVESISAGTYSTDEQAQ